MKRYGIVQAVLLSTVVLIVSTIAYRTLTDRTWLESFYHVVLTVSSVGYAERTGVGPLEQLLNILLIVVGMSILAYTVGAVLRAIIEGEIADTLGRRKMTRDINRLDQHVVICGFGRIGQMLTAELAKLGTAFVIIDAEEAACEEARLLGYLVMHGDATEEEVLSRAGIDRAKTLVTALPDDADNVFITLTARSMNRDLFLIARGEILSTQRKLLKAGANRVILPAAIGAQRIAAMITKPSTLELLDLVADREELEVELEEFEIEAHSPLVGRSLRDSSEIRAGGLLVVAVKPKSGSMVFNPTAEQELHAGDVIIAMGHSHDLARFGTACHRATNRANGSAPKPGEPA